jgi:predicted outer membrane protein
MNRRTTLLALGGAILPFAVARAAGASTTPAGGISLADYTTSVLQYGTLSRLTSDHALKYSQNPAIRDFATGEIYEQIAVAQALTSNANPTPPALTAAQEAQYKEVINARSNLDSTYLNVQIAGHEALLYLQKQVLADNLSLTNDTVHIALIAEAFIRNHLIVLQALAKAYQ